MVINHLIELTTEGVALTKTYDAHGPMALAFRLFFARGILREMPGSFADRRMGVPPSISAKPNNVRIVHCLNMS